ncbi:hypothetical protein GA0115255_106381 [Streptomyces sp. Ncost-T6T-2b]|nr:hypothetical protein GA0115255_106381 [Streptomyces sp. Ncost-T6T-2b]
MMRTASTPALVSPLPPVPPLPPVVPLPLPARFIAADIRPNRAAARPRWVSGVSGLFASRPGGRSSVTRSP